MSTQSRFFRRLSEGLRAFAGRLRRDERGAIAVQFAFLAIPMCILVFALVDLGRISLQRRQMQDALDAATLMAARSPASTDAELEAIGDPAFVAEIAGLNLGLDASNATFKAGADNHIIGTATGVLKPIIANLWTSGNFTVTATSDVVRSSKNLEVAMVLDITGSMNGTRISDLRTAAADLVDIIVKDAQTPFYSKVAIVPYAAGVNVGSAFSDAARGPIPVRAISGAAWLASAKTITGISKANPTVVTVANHGFSTGDRVYISSITGNMASLNAKLYTITKIDANSFSLQSTSTTGFGNYSSGGGSVQKCLTSACSIVVTTSGAHGFITNDQLSFASMTGLTTLNGTTQTITTLSTTTFDTGVAGLGTGAYASGGAATCELSTVPGCRKFKYTSKAGSSQTRSISDCVSERIGAEAYTDAAPSTAFVGLNYPSSGNPCPAAEITPLSSDRVALKAKIAALTDGGSTAGQIGLAWGWYMVSPNFGYMWPNASQRPAPYKTKDLMKVVILMTDGAFNTPYCNGVIAGNAGSGSGSDSDHINCDATNGSPFTQARALCTAIKNSANDITLYTVGFDVGNDATAKSFLTDCATDPAHVYFPSNGSELKTAFKAIAQEISSLRIAK